MQCFFVLCSPACKTVIVFYAACGVSQTPISLYKDNKNDYALIDKALESYEISVSNRSSSTAYSPSGKRH